MMVLLIFGLCGIACCFIVVSTGRLVWRRVMSTASIWRDGYFWLCAGFGLVSLGLLEFCAMRVWQALMTDHVPFVQSKTWALVASVTILLGLCAKMRVIGINRPSTGRAFLMAAGLWAAFCLVWGMI